MPDVQCCEDTISAELLYKLIYYYYCYNKDGIKMVVRLRMMMASLTVHLNHNTRPVCGVVSSAGPTEHVHCAGKPAVDSAAAVPQQDSTLVLPGHSALLCLAARRAGWRTGQVKMSVGVGGRGHVYNTRPPHCLSVCPSVCHWLQAR